jgi:hypothetical protein
VAESSDVLDLEGEIRRTVDEIHGEGVEHNDVREPNILWNAERGRATLIDLERSSILRPGGLQPLQELSPNRKRKLQLEHNKVHRRRQDHKVHLQDRDFRRRRRCGGGICIVQLIHSLALRSMPSRTLKRSRLAVFRVSRMPTPSVTHQIPTPNPSLQTVASPSLSRCQ